MTNPTVPVPPVAPYAPPGAPHAPSAPPYGAPGGAPPYGTPGAPQFSTAPGAPLGAVPPPGAYPGAAPMAPDAPKKSKAGLIIALLVVVLLLVGGAVAFLAFGPASGSDLTATIDECTIEADGSLAASGSITGDDGAVEVSVEFRNTDGDAVVDSASTNVSAPGSWDVSGSAPDDVQRVTCVVTELAD